MKEGSPRYERLRLSHAMVRAWYGSTLVGGTTPKERAEPVEAPTVQAPAAAPRREVLVFLRPLPTALQERGMKFLSDILKACDLKLDEVALFEGAGPGDLETLRTTCDPRAMLLFGIDPPATGLPLHIPHFQVTEHGGIKLICAPPVEEMFDDKVLKSNLWTGLKKIFGR
jgi:hypothetical protein